MFVCVPPHTHTYVYKLWPITVEILGIQEPKFQTRRPIVYSNHGPAGSTTGPQLMLGQPGQVRILPSPLYCWSVEFAPLSFHFSVFESGNPNFRDSNLRRASILWQIFVYNRRIYMQLYGNEILSRNSEWAALTLNTFLFRRLRRRNTVVQYFIFKNLHARWEINFATRARIRFDEWRRIGKQFLFSISSRKWALHPVLKLKYTQLLVSISQRNAPYNIFTTESSCQTRVNVKLYGSLSPRWQHMTICGALRHTWRMNFVSDIGICINWDA